MSHFGRFQDIPTSPRELARLTEGFGDFQDQQRLPFGLQQPFAPQTAFTTRGAQGAPNFLGSLSDFFRGQQVAGAQGRAIAGNRAQFLGQQAFGQAQQLGGFLDVAAGQQERLFQTGQRSLLTAINDPNLLSLIRLAGRRAREPGLPPDILRSIRGGAAARSAAGTSAALRNARFRLGGVSGPAREFILSSIRQRAGEAGRRQLADIDVGAAQFAEQQAGQSIQQAAFLQAQRANLIGTRAQFLGRFNPLNIISEIQGIQQPFQQIGFGLGRLESQGFGGGFGGFGGGGAGGGGGGGGFVNDPRFFVSG